MATLDQDSSEARGAVAISNVQSAPSMCSHWLCDTDSGSQDAKADRTGPSIQSHGMLQLPPSAC